VLNGLTFVISYQDEEVSIRAYEREGTENNSPYRDVTESMNDESFKQVIINRVKRDIESIENVLRSYQRLFKNPKKLKEAMQMANQSI